MMFTLMNLIMNPTIAMKQQLIIGTLDNLDDIPVYGKPSVSFDAPLTNETIPYYYNSTIHIPISYLKNIEWLGVGQYPHIQYLVKHEYCHYALDKYCHGRYELKSEEAFCDFYADGVPLDCDIIR